MAHKFLFNILVCGAISCHCARNGPHNVKCVNPFPSTLFPPLTAVVTADVTNLVLKDYWGPIEYVIMFIVSQQCAWMERHKTTRPITFDLYLCACVRARARARACAGCIERLDCMGDPQLSTLRLSTPPSNTYGQNAHKPDAHMPIQRQKWMFAYQYIHQNRHIAFQRTDNLAYLFKHYHTLAFSFTWWAQDLSMSFCMNTDLSSWLY